MYHIPFYKLKKTSRRPFAGISPFLPTFLLIFLAWSLLLSLPAGAAPTEAIPKKQTSPTPPTVSAAAAFLLQPDTDTAVFEKNAGQRLPMASTTKIMTAILVLEKLPLDLPVCIPAEAVGVEGSSIYLHAGETLTVSELLSALLLESANDAATALALTVGGSIERFAQMMNEKAASLGLTDTHFSNPHGLDSQEHYTTAADLAHLTAYCMQNPAFRELVSLYRTTIPLCGDTGTRVLTNHNRLLRSYEGVIGVKTGFTRRSGRCLVSAAERDGVLLIAVTLNAPDDWQDHTAMLDFGFSLFDAPALDRLQPDSFSLPVVGGTSDSLTLRAAETPHVVLPACHGDITARVELPHFLYAPIARGDRIGQIVYLCDGAEIALSPLYACYDIEKDAPPPTLFERIKSFFHTPRRIS